MFSFEGETLLLRETGDYVEIEWCDQLSTSLIVMHDTYSCVGNYSCTKEKVITFSLTLMCTYIYIYIYIYKEVPVV